MTKTQHLVEQAREHFDKALHTDAYREIHSDAAHLEALMDLLSVHSGKRYLDLGTGNGYLAFEMARRFPEIVVTGLDIAARSIGQNRELQREQGIQNLDFLSYDGLRIPFQETWFEGVISRYAFHHFPDPALSVQELSRISEAQGFVIISDPVTHEEDTAGFIDQFQQLRADGHIHFFRPLELDTLFQGYGFTTEARFFSAVSYLRNINEAYLQLLERTPETIQERYGIQVRGQNVYVTVTVMNVLYRKGAFLRSDHE